MLNKKEKDYSDLLSAIIEFGGGYEHFSWQTVMLDFEIAMWKSFQSVLPNVKILGCNFHFTQAVYRKIQHLGLSSAYLKKGSTHKFCRCLMTLAFPTT